MDSSCIRIPKLYHLTYLWKALINAILMHFLPSNLELNCGSYSHSKNLKTDSGRAKWHNFPIFTGPWVNIPWQSKIPKSPCIVQSSPNDDDVDMLYVNEMLYHDVERKMWWEREYGKDVMMVLDPRVGMMILWSQSGYGKEKDYGYRCVVWVRVK